MAFTGAFRNTFQSAFAKPDTATAFSPTSIASLQVMLEDSNPLWQDTGRTTPATAVNDPVAAWNDSSANLNYLTKAGGTAWKINSDGLSPSTSSINDLLGFQSTIPLTGALTVYAVAKRSATGVIETFAGTDTSSSGILIFSDNNFYFLNDSNSNVNVAYTGTNGALAVFRITRDGSNVVKFTSGGMAQTTVGTKSGTLTLTYGFNRFGHPPGVNCRQKALYIFNATLSAGDDSSMQSYLSTKYSVTF